MHSPILTASKNNATTVIINNVSYKLKSAPSIASNLIFIPFNDTMKANGYKITSDVKSQKTVYKKGSINIKYQSGQSFITKSGFKLDVNHSIQSINGVLMITLDLLGQLINATVTYDPISGHIVINDYTTKEAYSWIKENDLVAHALGACVPYTLSNSLEAMAYSYHKGFKLFEVDLTFTKDDHLVARHDWGQVLFRTLKQEVLKEQVDDSLSYSDFMNLKIYERLTPLDISSIIDIMSIHKDIYLITDTKETDSAQITKAFQTIVDAANKVDPTILDRIIPQIYNESMYGTVRSVYPFNAIIYTLYQTLDSDEKVIDFAVKNHLKMITMPLSRVSPKFVNTLAEHNIYVYVHTVNSLYEVYKCRIQGVHGFYTDFLTPKHLKNNR